MDKKHPGDRMPSRKFVELVERAKRDPLFLEFMMAALDLIDRSKREGGEKRIPIQRR